MKLDNRSQEHFQSQGEGQEEELSCHNHSPWCRQFCADFHYNIVSIVPLKTLLRLDLKPFLTGCIQDVDVPSNGFSKNSYHFDEKQEPRHL